MASRSPGERKHTERRGRRAPSMISARGDGDGDMAVGTVTWQWAPPRRVPSVGVVCLASMLTSSEHIFKGAMLPLPQRRCCKSQTAELCRAPSVCRPPLPLLTPVEPPGKAGKRRQGGERGPQLQGPSPGPREGSLGHSRPRPGCCQARPLCGLPEHAILPPDHTSGCSSLRLSMRGAHTRARRQTQTRKFTSGEDAQPPRVRTGKTLPVCESQMGPAARLPGGPCVCLSLRAHLRKQMPSPGGPGLGDPPSTRPGGGGRRAWGGEWAGSIWPGGGALRQFQTLWGEVPVPPRRTLSSWSARNDAAADLPRISSEDGVASRHVPGTGAFPPGDELSSRLSPPKQLPCLSLHWTSSARPMGCTGAAAPHLSPAPRSSARSCQLASARRIFQKSVWQGSPNG